LNALELLLKFSSFCFELYEFLYNFVTLITNRMKDNSKIIMYAKFFNAIGYSIAFGKIFGYLISNNNKTFEEIVKDLKLSKGSVSMTLKTMMQNGYLDYTLNAGERKKYFKISFSNWHSGLEKRINDSKQFVELLDTTLKHESNLSKEQQQTIKKLIGFEKIFQKKIHEIIAEFK